MDSESTTKQNRRRQKLFFSFFFFVFPLFIFQEWLDKPAQIMAVPLQLCSGHIAAFGTGVSALSSSTCWSYILLMSVR